MTLVGRDDVERQMIVVATYFAFCHCYYSWKILAHSFQYAANVSIATKLYTLLFALILTTTNSSSLMLCRFGPATKGPEGF